VEGKATALAGPVAFNVVLDPQITATPAEIGELVAFHRQVLKLQRAVAGASGIAGEASTRLERPEG
jgi:hypothetical protein